MTKTDIIKHNIAIAIYDGYRFVENTSNPSLYTFGGYLKHKENDKVVLPEMLDYHKSYNSLMRVVELIEKTNDTLSITKDTCRIVHRTNGIRYFEGTRDAKFSSKKFEAIYKMVINIVSNG